MNTFIRFFTHCSESYVYKQRNWVPFKQTKIACNSWVFDETI